ncbi:hypothetical protein BC936DRAFT_140098 [Jimgerdemannia flammicorona]|uniref:Uncharacterized protein n=1 Tax=Jimgerdemannia flammicorona TaxID=994334 RepID=A0A433B1V5_9FUNG|nr:hypothetical protein BC936DRAFT_140098 [Jimgerdemannia flammicorona]
MDIDPPPQGVVIPSLSASPPGSTCVIVPGNYNKRPETSMWYPDVAERLRKAKLESGGPLFPGGVVLRQFPDYKIGRESVWIPFLQNELKVGQNHVIIGHRLYWRDSCSEYQPITPIWEYRPRFIFYEFVLRLPKPSSHLNPTQSITAPSGILFATLELVRHLAKRQMDPAVCLADGRARPGRRAAPRGRDDGVAVLRVGRPRPFHRRLRIPGTCGGRSGVDEGGGGGRRGGAHAGYGEDGRDGRGSVRVMRVEIDGFVGIMIIGLVLSLRCTARKEASLCDYVYVHSDY